MRTSHQGTLTLFNKILTPRMYFHQRHDHITLPGAVFICSFSSRFPPALSRLLVDHNAKTGQLFRDLFKALFLFLHVNLFCLKLTNVYRISWLISARVYRSIILSNTNTSVDTFLFWFKMAFERGIELSRTDIYFRVYQKKDVLHRNGKFNAILN